MRFPKIVEAWTLRMPCQRHDVGSMLSSAREGSGSSLNPARPASAERERDCHASSIHRGLRTDHRPHLVQGGDRQMPTARQTYDPYHLINDIPSSCSTTD